VSFPFQIQHGILNDEENQNQQHCEIDFDRLADLIFDEVQSQQLSDNEVDRMIDEETLSIFDIMFWRGVANPQSGETYDCNNQIYDL